MATSSKQGPRSWERRILHREILKYGGSMLVDPEFYQEDGPDGSMSLGCRYSAPQLAADATLTGFAQLAALRMNCKHGFISLIDDKFQHVLAEATRTLSPYDVDVHGPGDELLVGIKTLDIEFGICPLTLAAFSKGTEAWIDTVITFADESRYVISDLLQEPRVSKARFMENNTSSRFYAEVPLRNSEGLVIGSISVIDSEPRIEPAAVDVRALQDIAAMTMEHFELIHIKEVSSRAERLMQGLGHFNSGKSSISQWIMDNPDRALARDGDDYYIQTPGTLGVTEAREDMPTYDPSERLEAPISALISPTAQMRGYFDRRISTVDGLSPPDLHPAGHSLPNARRLLAVQGELTPQPTTPDKVHTNYVPKSASVKPAEIVQSRVPADIHDAFSRASNLIRQSMDLDATCFLELSPDARFKINARKNSVDSLSRMSTTSSTKKSRIQRTESIATKGTAVNTSHQMPSEPPKSRLCSRLGLSTRLKSNTPNNSFGSEFATFPESALSRLAAEFPGGHIFTFDALGSLSAGEDDTKLNNVSARRKLTSLMVRHFPGARSLMFMPIYDNEKQQFYAGFFGWTTNPKRVLLENESVYVLGFANSIMCEVMRLETLAVEKAKSDFMSSMSHELRSPLHGILGATQLMQESELAPAQRELAMMIDSCGRTLLDIMNNLLEHAKINNIANTAGGSRRGSKLLPEEADKVPEMVDNQFEAVDLATLVEETVTSVAAGHAVREQRSEQVSTRRNKSRQSTQTINPTSKDLGPDGLPLPPAVIIDIAHRHNWVFETEAGSWRRIVMNLVGNALKYTQRGHIEVSLQVLQDEDTSDETQSMYAVLTVADTGQGISDSYLKHRLYTPFAQENNLSVGAGLGLSIVNRLVEALGGHIHMESELDVGTKVTVAIPLSAESKGHATLVRSNSVGIVEELRHTVSKDDLMCFVGFGPIEMSNSTSEPADSSPRSQQMTLQKLKASLSGLSTIWLGLSTTEIQDSATLLVVEESHAISLLKNDPSNPAFEKKMMIVNAFDHVNQRSEKWPGHCAFVCAPIGPIKFARVLSLLLKQDEDPGTPTIPLVDTAKRKGRSAGTNKTSVPQQTIDNSEESPLEEEPPSKRPRLARPPRLNPGSAILSTTGSSFNTETNSVSTENARRILLVEDNMINLKLLASFMQKLGLPYATATNGQEAVDEYIAAYEDGEPFQHVFMDITMPIMNGLTATRRIRAFEKSKKVTKAVEIIALTGLGHVEAQNDAMASGVDRYFCKPVRLDALKKLLIDKQDTT